MRSHFSIEIDLPPSGVTAHNTGHWRSKAGPVASYREDAAKLAKVQAGAILKSMAPIRHRVRIHHVWYLGKTKLEKLLGAQCPKAQKKQRPRDEGNAIQALKPAIDGLVDAGLFFDDSHRYLEMGKYVRIEPKEAGDKASLILKFEILHDEPIIAPVRRKPRKKRTPKTP